ncbi:MAG: FGGY family carbohydrate kinase [Pseudomonadota bacterium]
MSARLTAVIDIGKTNAKVVLIDADNAEVWERRRPNTVSKKGLYPHFQTEALWSFVLNALEALPQTPSCLVPVTHGACCALVKDDGSLALPVLDYEHPGPDSAASSYDAPAFDETGSPQLPGGLNIARQLHWQQATWPDAFKETAHILMWPQWWAFHLTGVLASEVTSLGCHTDLWNPAKAAPSTLAVKRGWANLIPPVKPAHEALGTVRPEIAKRTGLPATTPVLTGIHDSNASLLPYLDRAPCGVLSTGTWIIAMALSDSLPPLDPDKDMLLNVAADGRPVPTARFMGGRERDEQLERGVSVDEADRLTAERAVARLNDVGARGPTYVEGPFAQSAVFLETVECLTQRPVHARSGSGTTAGAALLAKTAIASI